VAETRDNTVLSILLESGKLTPQSLGIILVRKCDWHDHDGARMALEHQADPNRLTMWGWTALHQAIRRDNHIRTIELLLDYGADPALPSRHGPSAIALAAHRGRASALDLFGRRGTAIDLTGVDALIAACARDRKDDIRALRAAAPELQAALV